MAQQNWMGLLNFGAPWQTSQGTTLATATTATISPQAAGPQDFVLPQQYNGTQWYPGMAIRWEGRGTISTGGTTSSLTVFLACGVSGTLATTLTTTAAIVLGTGSLTGLGWRAKGTVSCIAIGSSGNTLTADGELVFETSTTVALGTANATIAPLPFTTTAFNTYTAATAMGLRGTLSAAFGSIQCNKFTLDQIS